MRGCRVLKSTNGVTKAAWVCGSLVALLATLTPVRAEIIDRIVAVVQGNVIMLSDIAAVRRLGLVVPPAQDDPVAWTTNRLIDRALMLIEVDRYSPPEPSDAAISQALAAVRGRFTSQAELDRALVSSGMSADQLRRFVRDDLRLDAYLDQRFGTTLQPSDDEVAAYYREHAPEFTRGGRLLPFDEVSGEVRAKLLAERRARLIADWVSGLRRRADVNVLYLPKKG